MADDLRVEVIYAGPHRQWRIPVVLPTDAVVETALLRSAIAEQVPGLDWTQCRMGIFSQPCTLETRLHEGDRIELYRPLQCDPKTVRRRRAAGESL